MVVKVILERSVNADNQAEVAELLKELRARAVHQQGYISGETLFSVDRPGTHVVISTWDSLHDWKAWEKNPLRLEVMSKIEALLSSESKVSVFAGSLRSLAEGV